ncbi:hypothetical protein BTO20_06870 [Mycobacterium dioxanotrophicus]|uniref:Uncharacterized protein n=1 Tax=Mycobacterium dioxanotrophicus TaxID=482462 RepID=A0A1Y0BZJ5_9MYCO|nr:hypothetical protein BTO20_06870 [Mycobacterium dioxanotrophicus]
MASCRASDHARWAFPTLEAFLSQLRHGGWHLCRTQNQHADSYRPVAFRHCETPWKSRRLLTLETRMQVCRRNSRPGSRRHVDTVLKRRLMALKKTAQRC